jgi:threonylcarbamoyladenosine tRNA methylthiotransferase MtaB
MNRIALHTLGCKLNYAETAAIGKQFSAHDYSIVAIDDQPDVVVINSCSVTSHADRECRQLVRKALRHSPKAFIAVVGCYAQLRPEQIAAIDGVDLVLGSKEKSDVFNLVHKQKKKTHATIFVSCINDYTSFGIASSAGFHDRTRAFIKVQDGCDYPCTYCTIPLARGKSRSTTSTEVIRQAQEAVDLGYKEIVLTGVNVGDYGKNSDTNLLALLKLLVKVDGLFRIRISSVEPNLLTDELLEFWFADEKLCKHWHIPLQSGSDSILKLMKRRYLSNVYADRVHYIKSCIPKAGIGADVIVGFPGETESQFHETYSFIENLPITYLHVFSYSERPHTIAATLNQKVEPRITSERSARLHALSLRKRKFYFEGFIDQSVPVLIESMHSDGTLSGLTEEYVRVIVTSKKELTNQIVRVTITEAHDDTCLGTIVNDNYSSAIRIAI